MTRFRGKITPLLAKVAVLERSFSLQIYKNSFLERFFLKDNHSSNHDTLRHSPRSIDVATSNTASLLMKVSEAYFNFSLLVIILIRKSWNDKTDFRKDTKSINLQDKIYLSNTSNNGEKCRRNVSAEQIECSCFSRPLDSE